MNRILNVLTPLLGILFGLVLLFAVRNYLFLPFSGVAADLPAETVARHYAFFLPASDHSFFLDLKRGARDAAEAMDCAVSFESIHDDSLSFELAALSGIDGAAVFVHDKNPVILEGLQRLAADGIPLVQIENEVLMGPDAFLIGTNSYESGRGIGRIAQLAAGDDLVLALVYSDKNPGLLSDANLVEMGIKSIMGDRLRRLHTARTSRNPIDAELVVSELLNEHRDLDIIVLTDLSDTLVTVQAVIDLNRVGHIQIIGAGENEALRSFLDKGVVLGTLVRNPYRIGYSAVMALREISSVGYTSAYIDTGVNILTASREQYPGSRVSGDAQ